MWVKAHWQISPTYQTHQQYLFAISFMVGETFQNLLTMHYWPHLCPHGILNRNLGLVVLGSGVASSSYIFGVCRVDCHTGRVRNIGSGLLLVRVWVALRVLSGRARKDNRSDTVEEVAGLLLHGLTLVVFRCASRRVMTSQYTCFRLLNTSRRTVDQGEGCRWE